MSHQTRLLLLNDDGKAEINVFVHGLCTDGPFPDEDYLKSDVNEAELRGKVFLFHWCSGCGLPAYVPFVAAAAGYITGRRKTDSVARSLIRALSRLRRAFRLPITLIGYSLGARVLASFLDQVSNKQFNLRRWGHKH
jgi:esterase/lipase superfamily enzyme